MDARARDENPPFSGECFCKFILNFVNLSQSIAKVNLEILCVHGFPSSLYIEACAWCAGSEMFAQNVDNPFQAFWLHFEHFKVTEVKYLFISKSLMFQLCVDVWIIKKLKFIQD